LLERTYSGLNYRAMVRPSLSQRSDKIILFINLEPQRGQHKILGPNNYILF